MFGPQLLKLVEKMIEMSEREMALLKQLKIFEAGRITTEKEPLLNLYQSCILKLKNDIELQKTLKAWGQFSKLKERMVYFNTVNTEFEKVIARLFQSQEEFVNNLQGRAAENDQPIKSYNRRGAIPSAHQKYIKQGGGSLSTLDQVL